MLCFLNNIQVKTPSDEKLRTLTFFERDKVLPLFFRKSKDHFDFEDIAKALALKNQYTYYKNNDKNETDWLFNFSMKTSVSGCPVTARFKILFGNEFYNFSAPYTRDKDNSVSYIDINDVWHVLSSFDSEIKLGEFANKRLGFSEEKVKEFLSIKLKKDYASLSLKAINKILPYLRQGLIYPHAIFLANMHKVIPKEIWSVKSNQEFIEKEIYNIISNQNTEKQIIEIVNGFIKNCKRELSAWSNEAEPFFKQDIAASIRDYFGSRTYEGFSEESRVLIEARVFELFKKQISKNLGRGEFLKISSIEERVKDFLSIHIGVGDDKLAKLYHPSDIEVYKPPVKGLDGNLYLGSPMISSIRNPMAMRSLHQLRKVINELIRSGVIDQNTRVHIEMARDLKNANERKALQSWQRDREKLRNEYSGKIKNDCGFGDGYIPLQDEILKYQLWEEQNHKCIYTGNEIGLSEFLGQNPKYDVEHTIPRSLSLDNSQENKTLCDNNFNRSVKRNKIPSELPNHGEILQRIDHWRERYENLFDQVEIATRQARTAVDKESKDRAIQKRHRLNFEMNYWRNKYNRFLMKDIPSGFKNSQLVDTGIITRYARMYLSTYFDKVYTVKGSTVADFRIIWGVQEEYVKKERVNHIHHCVDAITMACMTKENYERLAQFYHDWEEAEYAGYDKKPKFEKPWPSFAEDVREIEHEVLISHHTPNNFHKPSKKKLKIRGKIRLNKNSEPIYLKGDAVRGSLHKETNYGAIRHIVPDKEGNQEEKIVYVSRKPLDSLTQADINNIVDENIRMIITEGKAKEEYLKKELEKWIRMEKDEEDPIRKSHFNEKVQQVKLEIESLYRIGNKDGGFTPIKKVRCVASTVTNPLEVKQHRDLSKHEYKRHSHFANDSNYVMGIYEGADEKGKIKKDFILVNNLDAAKYYTGKIEENPVPEIHPKSGIPLKSVLKIGTMVILWEENPEEVWRLHKLNIIRRTYKIIGLSNQRILRNSGKIDEYATIVLKYINEARPGIDLKTLDGAFKNDEPYMAQRKLNHNQFNALVEGIDFKISPIGELKRIER
jgi:CRISPR-associated endonuclease Csn1